MTKDWFTEGMEELMLDLSLDAQMSPEDFRKAYSILVENGFIDYDVEKEIIFERYGEES